MIIKTNEGQTFSGTPREIVHQMNISSRSRAKNDRVYMEQVSERMILQIGKSLATDSPDKFIADLIETKMIIEESVS